MLNKCSYRAANIYLILHLIATPIMHFLFSGLGRCLKSEFGVYLLKLLIDFSYVEILSIAWGIWRLRVGGKRVVGSFFQKIFYILKTLEEA